MIYFLLNIIKNPHPPYWKILLFLRAAIIIPDKNGRLNFFLKIRKSMILDIAYISFLNCLQMTEIKVVEWNFPWKPIVTFRTSKRNSISTKKHFRLSDVWTQFKAKPKNLLKSQHWNTHRINLESVRVRIRHILPQYRPKGIYFSDMN